MAPAVGFQRVTSQVGLSALIWGTRQYSTAAVQTLGSLTAVSPVVHAVWQVWSLGMALLPQGAPFTRLQGTQKVSALAPEGTRHRHTGCCPFLQPKQLLAQRNIPVSGQRCSPTAFAGRRLLPGLGLPSLHLCYLQVTSTVPAEAHIPCLYQLVPSATLINLA